MHVSECSEYLKKHSRNDNNDEPYLTLLYLSHAFTISLIINAWPWAAVYLAAISLLFIIYCNYKTRCE